MRIGYILKKFPRLSETFILNELLALEAAGVEVEVFSLHPPDDEPVHASLAKLRAPVTVIRSLAEKTVFRVLERWAAAEGEAERGLLEQFCGRLQLHDPWRLEALNYAAVLAPLVQDRNIQHLHAHFATSAVATAAEVARLTSIPYSFTMHAKDIYRRGVNYSLLSERMAEAAFTRTVCEANARWLRQCCSAAACERLRVLYNGLDLTEWVIQPEPRERGLVVAVGRFVEKKGFHLLLEALAQLHAVQNFRLVMIGQGEDGERLKALAHELGIADRTEFPGALVQSEVRDWMARASVVAAPCLYGADGNQDALPTVLLEAAALGTPAVTTSVGGIPEIIGEDEGGWLIAPGDTAALATALATALDHPEEARKRGLAGRRRAERMFDQHQNIDHMIDWFEAALRPARTITPGTTRPSGMVA